MLFAGTAGTRSLTPHAKPTAKNLRVVMDLGINLDCQIRPVIKFSFLQLRQLTK